MLLLAYTALAAALHLASPPASGFSAHDPTGERILLGAVGDTQPHQPVPKAWSLGTWRDDGGTLALDAGVPGRDALWLAEDAVLGDGLVRARIAVDGRLDMSLLLRVRSSDPGRNDLAGISLSLAGNHARLDRWDRGLARPLAPAVTLKNLKQRRNLELVITLIGPQIVALVHDGDSFELLATLTAADPTYLSGQVGLRLGPKHAAAHRLTLLATRPAAGPPAKPAAPAKPGPIGALRHFFIDPAALPRLPGRLRARSSEVPVDGIASATALELGPLEAEQLRRSGVAILAERGDLPWSSTDPDFRARRGQPPTPTQAGFRVDESYKDPALVEGLLRAYAARFPAITRLVEIGRSHEGRPLLALKISDHPEQDEDEDAVLLNGAHHGSELMTIEYTLDAIQTLTERYAHDPRVRGWVDNLEILCVPLVNPDGNYQYMHSSRAGGRKNGRDADGDGERGWWDGVDLNRNYPFRWGALGELGSRGWYAETNYRGTAPASEPETAAMMRLASSQRFAAAISFHTFSTAILSPYTIDDVDNPVGDEAWSIATTLAAAAPNQPNGRPYRVRRKLYPVDGTDQDWHRHTHGTLAYLLEGSHHNPRDPAVRLAAVAATRPVWMALFDRVLAGPTLVGHVRDELGRPLEAVVSLDELSLQAGERWTSRPRDGRFFRAVVRPGEYTVRATRPGCPEVAQRVRVRQRSSAELVLTGCKPPA